MANGIVIIDKPAGWTSMDVCGKLRSVLKTRKVGHAGNQNKEDNRFGLTNALPS